MNLISEKDINMAKKRELKESDSIRKWVLPIFAVIFGAIAGAIGPTIASAAYFTNVGLEKANFINKIAEKDKIINRNNALNKLCTAIQHYYKQKRQIDLAIRIAPIIKNIPDDHERLQNWYDTCIAGNIALPPVPPKASYLDFTDYVTSAVADLKKESQKFKVKIVDTQDMIIKAVEKAEL